MTASFVARGAVAALKTPYNRMLVDALKERIPAWARSWDKATRSWIIDPAYSQAAVEVCASHGYVVTAPATRPPAPVRAEVWYLGRPKGEDGLRVAHGMDKSGAWRYIIDERALRQWFGVGDENIVDASLYAVIGVARGASEDEIKRAVKRALLQWHPDRCREPDAAERTRLIIEARDTLLDPRMRARYDAGLRVEEMRNGAQRDAVGDWRAPLRSGVIVGAGYDLGEKTRIVAITGWDDVTDARGRTLVADWRIGSDSPTFTWI